MAKKKNIKPQYRPVSYEEVYAAAKEIFGDTEKFWNSLHPSIQRLIHEQMKKELEK